MRSDFIQLLLQRDSMNREFTGDLACKLKNEHEQRTTSDGRGSLTPIEKEKNLHNTSVRSTLCIK